MIRNRAIFYTCLGGALIGILAYGVTMFICLLGRPSLGISRGSASLGDSKADGFYVGTYTPTKHQITLNDSSVIMIPNAWVEHSWKPGFNLLFQDTKKIADGYNVYIPIPHKESSYGIEIAEADQKFTSFPGMGFSWINGIPLGWEAYFDSLPDTLHFNVKQKKQDHDSWSDAIITDTILFKRAF